MSDTSLSEHSRRTASPMVAAGSKRSPAGRRWRRWLGATAAAAAYLLVTSAAWIQSNPSQMPARSDWTVLALILAAPWSAAWAILDLAGPGPSVSSARIAYVPVCALVNACLIWSQLAPPVRRRRDERGVTVIVGSRISQIRESWMAFTAGILMVADASLILLYAVVVREGARGGPGSLPDLASAVPVLGRSVGAAGVGCALYLISQRPGRGALRGTFLLALSVITVRGDWLIAVGRWIAGEMRFP